MSSATRPISASENGTMLVSRTSTAASARYTRREYTASTTAGWASARPRTRSTAGQVETSAAHRQGARLERADAADDGTPLRSRPARAPRVPPARRSASRARARRFAPRP